VKNWQRRLLGLGLPCLLAWALDIGLTLNGQPLEYWAGGYSATTEGAPFWRMLYAWHPAAAIVGHVLWACLLAGLLILLPEVLAVILTIAVVFGHTAGAYTWIEGMLYRSYGQAGTGWYQAANALFLAAAIVAGVGVRWTVRSAALHATSESGRVARWWRLGGAAVLFAIGAAIVFVPW
jgi:hypothetical protein